MIEHEVWINAECSVVFEALTTVSGLNGWWGRAVHADPEIGSVVEFDHGFDESLKMRIIDLQPATCLSWRYISEHTEPRNPASEWLVTVLQFRHDGWLPNSR